MGDPTNPVVLNGMSSCRRPIAGDSREMWRAVEAHIHYHMQHPTVLRYTVEQEARIACRAQEDSALLVVECSDGSRRIQRPLGPKAWEFLYEEMEKGKRTGGGVFIAGLTPPEAEEFQRRSGFHGEWIRDILEVLDLAEWDPALRGRGYKEFRQAVGRAKEADLATRDLTAEVPDGKNAPVSRPPSAEQALLEKWLQRKPREGSAWIQSALREARTISGFVCRAADFQGRPVAVSAALHQGRYGYLLFAFGERTSLRAQELLDYEILRELKNKGVTRLDMGCASQPGVTLYKEKLGPIRTEPLLSAWLPSPS